MADYHGIRHDAEAAALLARVRGTFAGHAAAHWRLGQVLEKQNTKVEAIAEIEQAVRMNPSLEDAKKDLKRLKD